jgi:hypothetical protein
MPAALLEHRSPAWSGLPRARTAESARTHASSAVGLAMPYLEEHIETITAAQIAYRFVVLPRYFVRSIRICRWYSSYEHSPSFK